MSFEPETQKTEYVSMGKGNFPARIVHLIDMGKQHIKGYNKATKQWFPLYWAKDADGNDIKNEDGYTEQVAEDTGYPVIRPMYRVTYEFPTKTREYNGEQKPRWLKKDYTFAGLKKLAEMLSEGKIQNLVSAPCLVNVSQTEGGFDKVVSVAPPVDGMNIAPLDNPAVLFDFDSPALEEWNNIPEWYKDDIKAATNFPGSGLEKMLSQTVTQEVRQEDFDDDIPY